MSMVTLHIEASGAPTAQTHFKVDASAFVGTCVASLVETWRFPQADITGRPVRYHLRHIPSSQPLPNMARFRDLPLRPNEMHFVLEAEEANLSTVPVETVSKHRAVSLAAPGHWSRRVFITWAFAGLSVAGLGAGLTTAFAQRYLSGHSSGHGPATSHDPHIPTATVPQGATIQFVFSAHQRTVRTVGWSPDGTMIASGGDDAQMLIWNPMGNVQQRVAHPASVLSLAWSPEAARIVTGAGTQVAFFQAITGTLLARAADRHTGNVTSVSWTPGNQMQVISGGSDTRAFVWETTTYQPQAIFTGHDTPIEAVSWGPDGRTVASSSQGGSIRVWNAATVQEMHGFYEDAQAPMRACAFAPIGTALAVGGNDGVIRIWNGLQCQQQHQGDNGLMCVDTPQRLTTSSKPIRSLAWSSDARYLASGSDDGTFSVWSSARGNTLLFTIMTTPGIAVHSLSWSPSGNQIAVASGNTVTLWGLHN